MRGTRRQRVILGLLLILGLALAAYAGLAIYQINASNDQADDFYSALADQVTGHDASSDAGDHVQGNAGGDAKKPPTINWATLKAVNPAAAAWLYQPGSGINYPVLAATNYGTYLARLADGTRNPNGTPFLDPNSPADLSASLTVIYGNDTGRKAMFGSLPAYKNQSYFDQHRSLYLATPHDGDFRVDLVYGASVPAGAWRQRAFMYAANLPALLDFAQYNSDFKSPVSPRADAHWLALAATTGDDFDPHYVVLGVLEPIA